MNYISIRTLLDTQNAYRVFEEILVKLSERPAYKDVFKDLCIKDILRQDTLDYLLCICACDKEFTFEEKETLAIFLNPGTNYEDLKEYITEKNLLSEKFYTNPPQILRILCQADALFYGFG